MAPESCYTGDPVRIGSTYEGFSLADRGPIDGDHTDKVASWNGSADLSSLRGKPVCLRGCVLP